MRKKALFICFLAAFCQIAAAQSIDIKTEMKTSYKVWNGGSAFSGDRLSLRMNGTISDKFSYAVYHNFHKPISKENPFSATDWAWVKYTADEHWSFTAGKQMTFVGGTEYDARTVDLHFASEWWNSIPCFKMGATAAYTFREGKDMIALELSESMTNTPGNAYLGYNLYWQGHYGCFTPIYSTNLFQYADDAYVHYMSLGNRFNFGKSTIEMDLVHRADPEHFSFFDDFTLVGYYRYDLSDVISLFAKYTRDKALESCYFETLIPRGIDMNTAGAGVEFFPANAHRNVRLHACYYRQFGTDTVSSQARNGRGILNVGVSWFLNILHR